jgi:hypothetical protein
MGGRGGSSNMSGGNRPITPEEIEALQFYADGNGRDMNLYLRTGDNSSDVYGEDYGQDIADYSEIVDGLLQRSSLPNKMTVYRGGDESEVRGLMENGNPSSLVGKTYQNKGMLSTTTDKGYAESLANDSISPVVFEIGLKKGAKAMNIEPYARRGEQEVLGASGRKFKITSARTVNGVLHVRMTGG